MSNCIFCQIAKKEIPSKTIHFEDKDLIAFDDLYPKAPIHILIVPKKHIVSVNELKEGDQNLIGKIILVAKKLAKKKKIDQTGYKIVVNTGPDAGQGILHLHFHLLGGGPLSGIT